MAENVEKIISIQLKANDAINGLKDLNAQIDANKTRMKELAAANQKGSAEYAKLEQQTKALSQTKQYLSKETQNEIKLEYEEEGSLRKLRAELSKATQEFDKLSRAERENGARGKELKAQINSLTNEIKAAEEGTQRYYRNVGNYQNAILNAVGLNGRFGQSIMALTNMEGTMTSSFSAMGASVKAFGASLMSLLTNPVFLTIAGIAGVGMAFKFWYDYNNGLMEATRLTKEFLDLTGDRLTNMRDSIRATADTYGKDFKEVLEGVDTITSHWHMSAEEALDVINDGFAAGADLSGNMLDNLEKYAPALRDAGFTASQTMALIAQTRSGIFSEQGLEAIRQAGARLRDMSSSTRDALRGIGIDADDMARKLSTKQMDMADAIKLVASKLKDVGYNSQEAGAVMSNVFGKAGKFASEEMIRGLDEIETNLDIVKGKTGEWGEDMDALREKDEDLNQAIAELFDFTGQGFEHSKKTAQIFVKDGLLRIVKGLQSAVNWFKNLWNSSKAVRLAFVVLANVIHHLWMVWTGAWRILIAGAKTVGDAIVALGKTFDAVKKNIKNAFNGVAEIFRGIAKVNPDMVAEGWRKASQAGAGAVKNFVSGIKETFGTLKTNVTSTLSDIKDEYVSFGKETLKWMDFTFSESGGSDLTDLRPKGSGDPDKDKDKDKDINNYRGGSGGKTNPKSGGGSTTKKPTTEDEIEAEKKRIEQLANKLLDEAEKARQRAVKELAKVDKDEIDKMFNAQKKAAEDKYDELLKAAKATNQFDNNQLLALQQAQNAILKDIEEQRRKAQIDLKTAQDNMLLQNKLAAETDPKRKHELELQQLDNQQKAELIKIKGHEEEITAILAVYAAQRKKLSSNASEEERKQLEEDQLKALVQYTGSEELTLSVLNKFAQKRVEMTEQFAKQQLEAQQKLLQAQMDGMREDEEGRLARLKLNLELLQLQMDEELKQYENNEAMRTAIKEKYLRQQERLEKDYADKEREIQYQRYEAIAAVTGGMGQLMAEFQDDNKSALIASKILALGEIMISQAVAIANAVKAGSNAVSPWQMIAQIAASVTAVTVAMAQAFKSLNQAKFATGGYVRGAGTGTSDSIPVRVSNGESIMNANTTAMFGGLLSSLNQLGGGVPIQVQETASSVRGEDMLARAVARGVAMLPAPVVSVEDINRGQRQVEVMNEQATL